MTVRFPETGQTYTKGPFGYITGDTRDVHFFLIQDADVMYTFWFDPPLTDEPEGLLSNVWDSAIFLLSFISCLDGS